MNSIHHLTINRPQQDIWEFINTLDNRKKWVDGLLSSNLVKGTTEGEGSILRTLFFINGSELEFREEIEGIIPGEIIKIKLTNRSSQSTLIVHLRGEEVSTHITVNLMVKWKGIRLLLLKSLWRPSIEKTIMTSLDSLKKVLETDSGIAKEEAIKDKATA